MSKKSEPVGIVTPAEIAAARDAVAAGVKEHADALNALEALDVSKGSLDEATAARVGATERVTVARQRLMLARERLVEAEGRAAQARLDILRVEHDQLARDLEPMIRTIAADLEPLLSDPDNATGIVREYFKRPRELSERLAILASERFQLETRVAQWAGSRQAAADRKKREEQAAVYEALMGGAA